MERVELAWHTGFSRKNGIGFGSDIADFAMENDIKTIVITDAGNVDGYVDIQHNLKRKGLDTKLIMGVDLSVFDDRKVAGKIADSGRLSVLIRNETGKKNLYRIISEGESNCKNGREEPQIPISLLLDHREGLLIGSGSENGLFMDAQGNGVLESNTAFDEDNYRFLDYVEIPCAGISGETRDKLMELADFYKLPAVATCAPHYMKPEESRAYAVLKNTPCECAHYRSTDEMLDAFAFMGKEKAYEIVVTNSNLIADMCDEVQAVPDNKIYPLIDNQDDILRDMCEEALLEKYKDITPEIKERLEWELNAIRNTRSAFMFIQIRDVIDRLGLLPFEINPRGTVGSSIVAYLCGISEVDPIRAKLSPYFFFGFDGDKEPDIDLNFGVDIQSAVHKAFADVPGVGTVIKPGTIVTIDERYAEGLIDAYGEERHRFYGNADRHELADTLSKCVKTRDRHPGGLIMLPKNVDISDICPVTCLQCGNDLVEITAYDYYSIDHIAYKFDALGHRSPQIVKKLYDMTGVDPRTIRLDDAEVMEMFKVREDRYPACAGIPEFFSEFAFNAMRIANCRDFDDLVKLDALMNGTDVWIGNAEILIKEGTATIKEVPADRDDVYDFLIRYGLGEETAYKITEAVRMGKISCGKSSKWDAWKQDMLEHGVPDWFVWSCEKIKYMFPRAHSYSYMLNAWRMAWYKLHYPLEFYTVMLNVTYYSGFDPRYMAQGKEKLKTFMHFIMSEYASKRPFANDARSTGILLDDYYEHGFEFKISDESRSGDMFRIIDDHTIEVDGCKAVRNLGL